MKRDYTYCIYLNFENFIFQDEFKNNKNIKNISYVNSKDINNKYYNFIKFMEKNVGKQYAEIDGKNEVFLHMTYERIDENDNKEPLYFIWF